MNFALKFNIVYKHIKIERIPKIKGENLSLQFNVILTIKVLLSLFFLFSPLGCLSSGGAEAGEKFRITEGQKETESINLESIRKITLTPIPATDSSWKSGLEYGTKRVYLTFDDGPKPYATENVLEILDEEKTKATFFLIGRKAEKWPNIVREIVSRGHTIGNHTYSHIVPWGKNYDIYIDDAIKGKKILEQITGIEVPLFRPPGGNRRLLDEIEKRGMKVVLWTTLSGDCLEGTTPEQIKHLVKRQEMLRSIWRHPMIILLHDTNSRTASALPEIIRFLKKRGYIFTTEWRL